MSRRSLRVLLFAHHQVGVSAFHGLQEAGHQIAACFTHPPSADWVPSLADACRTAGVPVSESVPLPADAQSFREQRPDLILSVGYRRRISLPFLALPRWGAVNAHFAPLPRYRGGAPIPWGILNGESAWAVTLHAMTHNYNEGGILQSQPVALRESDNAYDLFVRCTQVAARAVVDMANDVSDGRADLAAQDLRDVRFYEAAPPFGGRVDWNQSATALAAFVRALDFGRGHVDGLYEHLTPAAAAVLGGRDVTLWRARAGGTVSPFPAGTVTRTDGELWVQTGRGHLVVDRLCDATGRNWTGVDYCAAHEIEPGVSFDTSQMWRTAPAITHAA